jgi:hypothetical protein
MGKLAYRGSPQQRSLNCLIHSLKPEKLMRYNEVKWGERLLEHCYEL